MVTEIGTKADPEIDTITVDGRPIELQPQKVYILLNKPKGYTSTLRDPHARRVITDLVKDLGVRVYPVGRLDADTEGLIILTNDGDFAFKITHPRHHVPKTYRAEIKGLITQQAIEALRSGIHLEDGPTQPVLVERVTLNPNRKASIVEIVIHEGRKRQIRRMFRALGHPVVNLARIKIGNIESKGLRPGEWRFLEPQEIQELLALAK